MNDAKGMQEWGNFPHERKRHFDLVGSTGAKGVVLLSGNVHYAEVSKTEEGRYPLYDFTSSGMTHNSTAYAEFGNPYRVSGPYTENNFGLVEIDWDADPSPVISMKTIGLDGNAELLSNLVYGRLKSSGFAVDLSFIDTVDELDTVDHVGELLKAT